MKKLILDIDRVQLQRHKDAKAKHGVFGEPPGLEEIEKREGLAGARRMRVSSWKPPTTQWSSG
jgi:hypothetical protein